MTAHDLDCIQRLKSKISDLCDDALNDENYPAADAYAQMYIFVSYIQTQQAHVPPRKSGVEMFFLPFADSLSPILAVTLQSAAGKLLTNLCCPN